MLTLLRGGMVFDGTGFKHSDIFISDGIVSSIIPSVLSEGDGLPCSGVSADKIIDINNKYVFPGFVDVHVHFREPGFTYKEDIATGSASAAAGGYTDVCAMPNLNPVPDSPERLAAELEAIKEKAQIHVYPYGSLSVDEKGERLSEIEAMAADVIAFSDDGRGLADDALMLEAMERVKKSGRLIAAHCEDMTVIGGAHVHDGAISRKLGIKGITSESEWKMVERDAELAAKTGCPYHVCHVSTKESVEIIRKAKADGVDITCETGPHYLLLDENDILKALEAEKPEELGRFKMNPPLRSAGDREALIEGLLDGTIDMIATDHAPHSTGEKAKGLLGAPMGVVGLECAFPVLHAGLVRTGLLTPEKLVTLMSTAPAKRFGIESGIREGAEAKLTVYDLDDEHCVSPDTFMSKGRFTPFDGSRVYARCLMTICGKETVWECI